MGEGHRKGKSHAISVERERSDAIRDYRAATVNGLASNAPMTILAMGSNVRSVVMGVLVILQSSPAVW